MMRGEKRNMRRRIFLVRMAAMSAGFMALLKGRTEWADLEIGCMGQSLFLEAVALGLGSCIFANIAAESVAKTVGLQENQMLRIAQAVGGTK